MTIALFWIYTPRERWTRTKVDKLTRGCTCDFSTAPCAVVPRWPVKVCKKKVLPRPQTPLEEAALGSTSCPAGFKVIVTPFWLYALTLPRFLVPHLAMLNPGL